MRPDQIDQPTRRRGSAPLILAAGLVAALAAAAPAAIAAPLPTLHSVTDVAADDRLNIRERPSASAPVIGSLAPDATGIEVIGRAAGWLRVNAGERSGWVNARFMAEEPGSWPEGGLPDRLRCFGTEPFWSMTVAGERLVFSRAGEAERTHPLLQVLSSHPALPRTALASGLTAVITPAECSDGMSDRAFGLTALLLLGAAPKAEQLNGCCSLQP